MQQQTHPPLYRTARFTQAELAAATGGRWVGSPPLTAALALESDSRLLDAEASLCFIPLVGERFDGHAFIAQMQAGQAVCSLCSTAFWESQGGDAWAKMLPLPLLVVGDTLDAFQALARWHRRRCSASVVAITGSSGKTTVKEQLAAVLHSCKRVQATYANYNNDIGVAKTLLALEATTEVLIVEMGMRGLGEIERLSRCCEPDIAVITNIGSAHIGRLGSLEAIAQAKLEVLAGLVATGTFILNADDAFLVTALECRAIQPPQQVRMATLEAVHGLTADAQQRYHFSYMETPFALSQAGLHQVSNALLVAQTALALGLPLPSVADAFAHYHPTAYGRYEVRQLDALHRVVFDAYNANPHSLDASLKTFLASQPQGKRLVILGTMQELGSQSEAYHHLLLDLLQGAAVDALVLIGSEAAGFVASWQGGFPFPLQVLEVATSFTPASLHALAPDWSASAWEVFIKGSRSHGLEVCLEVLKAGGAAS